MVRIAEQIQMVCSFGLAPATIRMKNARIPAMMREHPVRNTAENARITFFFICITLSFDFTH